MAQRRRTFARVSKRLRSGCLEAWAGETLYLESKELGVRLLFGKGVSSVAHKVKKIEMKEQRAEALRLHASPMLFSPQHNLSVSTSPTHP